MRGRYGALAHAFAARGQLACYFLRAGDRRVAFHYALVDADTYYLFKPGFDPALRALAITALVVFLDAVVVAPIFERSFAMFRSLIGTWIPFAAIFLASLAAGILFPP